MKRKRLLLIFACLAAVLLAGYGTLWLTAPSRRAVPPHRITEENTEAIREGMSKREIEEIFGVPAGSYISTNADEVTMEIGCTMFPSPIKDLERGFTIWLGDEGGIYGRFDQGGNSLAIGRLRDPMDSRAQESFLAKLRRWLGMQ